VSPARDHSGRPGRVLYRFAAPPGWAAGDFWLSRRAPEVFAEAAAAAVAAAPACRRWVTIDALNSCALRAYLLGPGPSGRGLDVAATVRSLDNLLTAHVLAYDAIHRIQPDAVVGVGTHGLSVYEVDRLALDVLLAPSAGVDRYRLGPWLAGRRRRHYAFLGLPGARTWAERGLRRLAAAAFPLEQALPRATDAVYRRRRGRCVDLVQVDLRHPIVADHLRVVSGPGPLRWRMATDLWSEGPGGEDAPAFEAHPPAAGVEVWLAGPPGGDGWWTEAAYRSLTAGLAPAHPLGAGRS